MANRNHISKDKKKLITLRQEYDNIQKNIFNYKEYTMSCNGKPLSPRELIYKRDDLFLEISELTRKLRKQGVVV